MACLPGCGGCESYESPPPPPPEKAAPETFEIRSLTANGRPLLTGGPITVSPDAPVTVEANILFREGRPPFLHVLFINPEEGRDVIHNGSFAKPTSVGRSDGSSTFSTTLDAPRKPGDYIVRVMAPPHNMWQGTRSKTGPDAVASPRVYATGRLIVSE